jgi:hypothetical protein
MKKIFISVILLSSIICAQSFQIKQITNLPEDCRNFVRSTVHGFGNGFYAFESHMGNGSTINLGVYNAVQDSFYILTNVTNDNFMNINPQLIYSYDTLFIIYQTNKNGNWDIAYNIYANNQISPVYYLANSTADEMNPITQDHYSFMTPSNYSVLYEKNGSIFMKDISLPNVDAVEIFQAAGSITYSQPSIYWTNVAVQTGLGIAAKKTIGGKPSIVFKLLVINRLGEEIIVADSGNVDSPEFQYNALSYNNDLEGKKNIYLVSDLSNPRSYEKLILNPQFDYFNFKTDVTSIITNSVQYYSYFPYSYQVLRNDSLFIRLNPGTDYYYPPIDTLIYTKVKDSKLYLGLMGFTYSYAVFYTFWEDSVNGKIDILGRKTLVPIGGVKDNLSPYSFSLEQNYPNPFNPSTSIEINIASRGNVKLAVYDITGREVCTLMNEDKMPGGYVVKFDTRKYNLSSGVYFYKLTSGLNFLVKKLVLLK